jgi:small-conductance mechanosensitive channel
VLAAALAMLLAVMMALAVARVLHARRMRGATAHLPLAAHWMDHALEGALTLAPILAAIATLFAGHLLIGALGISTGVIMEALRIAAALLLLRLVIFVLGILLGAGSWVRTRGLRITLILWVIATVAMLGWLDVIEASLNRVNLVPGRTQFSLWALLKGLVVVSAFVVVASLIARALERHVMRLDQLAVSTRVGVSKFANFLLVGLGILLGINAAGVDVTTLNVLTGAIGLGLGFGLQSVASNFVSGFVLLMDKSIKPGDVISFTGHAGASTGNFGWVQELRGRYVVVRDRDGVDTLVPNQNLITSPFINWSYSDQRVRLKLPVTVSYDDDPEKALNLLVEAAANHPRILRDPPPVSRLISFEDSGMRLEIRFWIADPVNGVNNVRSDVNRAIWRIFRAHGVTMPVPQRETRLLQPRPAPRAPDEHAQAAPGRDRAAD